MKLLMFDFTRTIKLILALCGLDSGWDRLMEAGEITGLLILRLKPNILLHSLRAQKQW